MSVKKSDKCGSKSRTSLNLKTFFNSSFLQLNQQNALKKENEFPKKKTKDVAINQEHR